MSARLYEEEPDWEGDDDMDGLSDLFMHIEVITDNEDEDEEQ